MHFVECVQLFCANLWQVFASSQVNGNSGNIEIETVMGADSVDSSSDGVEDDNTDNNESETDSALPDNFAELPALD